MIKKTITRRLFSRATLAAPVALAPSTYALSGEMSGGGVPYAGDLFGTAEQVLQNKVWNAVHKRSRVHKHEKNRKRVMRNLMGGLDPDIAALGSLPYSTQARM